jgi:3-oxoacyl-[acyl-carrier-protein] synthase III
LAVRTQRFFSPGMKTNLAVIGQGAVTPTGVGLTALFQGNPVEVMTPLVARPDRTWPVYRVDLKAPAFERWQKEPRLRRASPISFFLVEAAEQALAGLDAAQRAETGLVIAFSTGCLNYSRRFFEAIITQGQKAASPALFPETVFNSPVSHVAATLRLEGAAYALAGDETAWIAALKTAWLWIDQGRVKNVLVLGAEEFDSASFDAYQNAGWLRHQNPEVKFIPAEGAAGLLLRKAGPDDKTLISQLEDGFIYRSKAQATAAGERCLQHFDSELYCYGSAQHNWLGEVEKTLVKTRKLNMANRKHSYLGEATTASAAWNTIRALDLLGQDRSRLLVPVWGTTHQMGALEAQRLV